MYQRHSFGAPPPIFTPPPAPYSPKHRAYATGKQPTASSVVRHQEAKDHEADASRMNGGFPSQLSLLQQDKPQPVPAIAFSDSITQSVADIFNKEVNIYVTPTDYFTAKFRQVFKPPISQITTSKYARPWMKGPNMGILAAAAKLCRMVCNNRLWSFP